MNVFDFVNGFFITPIYTGEGYNIYNTIVYAVLLIAAVYGVYNLLKRMNISPNRSLFNALVPYVLFGGILRALEDVTTTKGAGLLPHHWLFITPGIYILMFVVALTSLILATKTKNSYGAFEKTGWAILGIEVLCVAYVGIERPLFFAGVLVLAGALTLIIVALMKRSIGLYSRENAKLIWSHMLDATASSSAIALLGYREQHVLTGFLMELFGTPFIFVLVKAILVVFAIYVIDRESTGSWNWILKVCILVLGLGPGTRNITRVLMGV